MDAVNARVVYQSWVWKGTKVNEKWFCGSVAPLICSHPDHLTTEIRTGAVAACGHEVEAGRIGKLVSLYLLVILFRNL